MMQSVFSLARLDEARQRWVVESDEPRVVKLDAGLSRREVVPISRNVSFEHKKVRERTTPAGGWLEAWWSWKGRR
jgi:hypothetical protein